MASQCTGGGGDRNKRSKKGKRRGGAWSSCEEDERCFIDGGQAWEPVKAARRALSPKGRVGVDANPAGARPWRGPAGGQGRRKTGAMRAVSGSPLAVVWDTLILWG